MLLSFYRVITAKSCSVKGCKGKARIRKAKNGGATFIGCTLWAGGQQQRDHLYVSIPHGVDEDELANMLDNGGQASTREDVGNECAYVAQFGSKRKDCCKWCPTLHLRFMILTSFCVCL